MLPSRSLWRINLSNRAVSLDAEYPMRPVFHPPNRSKRPTAILRSRPGLLSTVKVEQAGDQNRGHRNLKELHPDHFARATAIRALAMDAVQAANSGHPGMPMGMADVATVLFEKHLKFDAANPDWPTATGSSCRQVTARCCFTRCCTSPGTKT